MVRGLAVGEDSLDKDPHVAFGRVPAANHTETQALPARALLKGHGVKAELVEVSARPTGLASDAARLVVVVGVGGRGGAAVAVPAGTARVGDVPAPAAVAVAVCTVQCSRRLAVTAGEVCPGKGPGGTDLEGKRNQDKKNQISVRPRNLSLFYLIKI